MSGLSFSILWEWKADRAQKSKTWETLYPTYRTIEDAFIDSRIDVCQVVCQAVFLSKPSYWPSHTRGGKVLLRDATNLR